jgi:hypothetical protein
MDLRFTLDGPVDPVSAMDGHNLKDKHKERKHRSKKREHHGESDDSRKHKKRKDKEALVRVVDDDLEGQDMWVEKNIDMDGEEVRKSTSLECFSLMVYRSKLQQIFLLRRA